jgi:7-keto-8-aminopelargonate synthetase-like enzyme
MPKTRTNKFIDTIDECLTNGVKNGIFQVSLENETFNGRHVSIGGRSVVNFGSCSYLGLEVDERLKQGAIDATMKYGTQYSSSRLFSACNLYEEIEDLFSRIFGHPSILAATTTLTHLGALPILVQDDDLIILDHQVHGSVQLAVQVVKARGTRVEMIRHSNMSMLEDLIKENPNKYNKIWYMADGLYSMYGDFAPLTDIASLLNKYGNFYVYIDDAHGMSWAGKNGSGYVLSQMPLHPKMVLSTSLAKGFGTGGGVTVLQDQEMRRKIVTCGSSYTFSGPVQPPMIGASIASAKIHLSNEIYELQTKLEQRINLTSQLISQYHLPHVLPSNSPIFYLALGLPRVGYNMVKRLLNEGYYTNIGIFPGVPVKCCGLRLAVTNGQTQDDIKGVLDAYQHHLPQVLEEEGQTIDDISTNFSMDFSEAKKRYVMARTEKDSQFDVQHETTIHKIDKALWDRLLGDNGTFDWEGCRFIEETFQGNPEPENNWDMHYVIIRDRQTAQPILATFFSVLLCKDDMIAPESVSKKIEEIRRVDSLYLTSKIVMMGSLLSEGEHIFVKRVHPFWKDSVRAMISLAKEIKKKSSAAAIHLRDFQKTDIEMRDFLVQEGFFRYDMPDTLEITNVDKTRTVDTFLNSLSSKTRYYVRKNTVKAEVQFSIKNLDQNDQFSTDQIIRWYELYKNVKNRSYTINTFTLPFKLFENVTKYKGWQIIEIHFNAELNAKYELRGKPIAMIFCYSSVSNNFSPMIIGLDYSFNDKYLVYRQALYQMTMFGRSNGYKKIFMGMDATIEKQKYGAIVIPVSTFIQADDNYNFEVISTVQNTTELAYGT